MRILPIVITLFACASARPVPGPEYERVDLQIDGVPSRVVIHDVTGEGVPDLLVTTRSHLLILEGDGTGGFQPPAAFPAGENPVDLAIADFDGDGDEDIVFANHETDYLALLLGSGDGGFQSADWSPIRIDVGPHPHAVLARDLDGDGRIDLVVDHRDGEGILILAGRGDGRFDRGRLIGVGGDPYRGMWLDDLDSDGHLDAIAPIETSVSVRPGDGRGGFESGSELRLGGLRPFTVRTLDWNGDGHPDIAAGSGEGQTGVAVLIGDGEGAFVEAPGSPFDGGPGPKELAVADVDGDGRQDLLVTAWDAPLVTVLYGGTDGPVMAELEVGTNPFGVVAGDLNGDGFVDIATANQGDRTVTLLLSGAR